MDWELEGKPPKFDDIHEYKVWIYGGVRTVRRIGNRSTYFWPGTLVYTDCVHPMQNALCNESDIKGWKLA